MTDSSALLDRLRAFEGLEVGTEPGADPVNLPMIRHWCEAIGDTNPVYLDAEAAAASVHGDVIAPATMLQAWTMRGLRPREERGGDAAGERTMQDRLLSLLDEAGFTSVVATNCEQEYFRSVRLGDHLSNTSRIESVSEEKKTGLGVGHFVTTRQDYRDQHGELVASMLFRILKFAPAPKEAPVAARPKRPRPSITEDNAFWFAAAKAHRLLIQRCTGCGALRHPPGPCCPTCRSFEWDTVEASGRGIVFSFVVNHHPEVPAFDYPLAVALIELEEGTRMVANLDGIDLADVTIGLAVEAHFVDFDGDLTLPVFRPAGTPIDPRPGGQG